MIGIHEAKDRLIVDPVWSHCDQSEAHRIGGPLAGVKTKLSPVAGAPRPRVLLPPSLL